MKQRVITGTLMFLAVLIIFFVDNYNLNFIILGVVLYLSFKESIQLFKLDGCEKLVFVALAFYTLSFVSNPIFCLVLAILVIVSFVAYQKSEDLNLILPFIYPSMPIFMMWAIYSQYGVGYLAWVILSVAASDTGAYFVGKKYGHRPFSKSSPNKTLEGVLAGLFLGTVIGAMYSSYFMENALYCAFASFLMCAFGVFGDLFESYLKRRVDIKDSGNILPGHGGVLDRIDGYLFAAPVLLWTLSW
ncbi:phosphatidate cytidylyltransferase [Campylobacter pinnipediorum subsp. caledonicus]|uniref:phosphatidate cytidylyltransferase n=1 Tax=Campylobacter pinnipediorum TaxID=1965231 RepID=UPI0009954208|nr:phosphatidate cytidylyltransferase [Campylobacter pinnipediorum]OPA72750.1 phosphatidate cytidylyltransferase [Campylobacter pinnipediorum subsp. caledonicus]